MASHKIQQKFKNIEVRGTGNTIGTRIAVNSTIITAPNEDRECIRHLQCTDPRDDKKRIEDTKGGLLDDSYRWILENSDFQRWCDDEQSRLLWIKGDPGKGKTMLLCGLINELSKSTSKTHQLSYFFCQATDSRINNATAVLRGLLYLLVNQQPSLISHIRKKHDHAGKALFDDVNAWFALSEIFTDILQDPSLNSTSLVIDALDECIADQPKLLDFIVQNSSGSSHVKWIVSSRNWPNIEKLLDRAGHKVKLCLELNAESISTAVSTYIQHKVNDLAQYNNYSPEIQQMVFDHLSFHANETFLWVALVCQDLKDVPQRNIQKKLATYPPGLDSFYKNMIKKVWNSDDVDYCKSVLATTALVYQPISLKELTSLTDISNMSIDELKEIVLLCGSFLTIRESVIYFIHQSAKDFLFKQISNEIFPSGQEEAHYQIFSRSLSVMYRTLQRDMYSLGALGYPAEQIEPPDRDPLAASRYPCIYWIDHLCEWNPGSSAEDKVDLQDGGAVDSFLRQRYLYWLEALSLCKSMSNGVVSMAKLEAFIQGRTDASALNELIRDARRFIMSHKQAMENSPLQAYASALLFSPTRSLIRGLFKREEPHGITIEPAVEENWSACLLTLEGHSSLVTSVAFSPDSTQLASGSYDYNVKIWDPSSGACLQTLGGHKSCVTSVAFSPDSTRVASGSWDRTIKIWDASCGNCLLTLKGHESSVLSIAFSPDSTRLASGSEDHTIKIWDASRGNCLSTLKGHSHFVKSVAFSPDSTQLASGSLDNTIKIWDASSGACLQTLRGHKSSVTSVAFSPDSTRVASGSQDRTIKIWDASWGDCLSTLEGQSNLVLSVAFSLDSTRLASGFHNCTIKTWDVSSGDCLQTLEGHSREVTSVAFSPDSTRLASGSYDRNVKIWDAINDAYLSTCECHSRVVTFIIFSDDSTRLASGSDDCTIKIWDASSGDCLLTLKGHKSSVLSIAFSPDSTRLASGSMDGTIKIWDASSGDCFQTLEGHSSAVLSVAFSPDLTRLASGSDNKTVKIWDVSSGDCLQTLEGHSREVTSVAFSPDSTRVASGSWDRTIEIWDASSGDCLQTLEGHSSAFSPDSTWLASGSDDKTVHQGLGMSTDRKWISYDSENILWLPPEYRPSHFTVSKNRIGIGTSHGKVRIYNVVLRH
ncbi:WD40 repeat-like protein [Lojkania enalia]|uniref:Mitochondrial division protein 1 n=1 Tax=Lojkania enalia TaxID=147567 RepID=A0A9P4JYL6_9PLEO|nr:WD40 repeat-like protein [Didymosphaeria enalia]